ncbi:MAG: hypothetical protein ACKUBY_05235 [Candidatus Moraniibacteriota bacterium]|jgi:multidrug transporter EmrE-like cation transporter
MNLFLLGLCFGVPLLSLSRKVLTPQVGIIFLIINVVFAGFVLPVIPNINVNLAYSVFAMTIFNTLVLVISSFVFSEKKHRNNALIVAAGIQCVGIPLGFFLQ